MSASRPHPPASVAVRDAQLAGEHAATHVRSPTEGSDEYAGARRAPSFRAPAPRAGSNGGNLDPLAPTRPLKHVRQNA
jgi:hypothetical protein